MSLRARLLWLTVLAVVPLLATQFYNEWSLRRDREADVRQQAVAQASLLSDEIAQLDVGIEMMLTAIARSPVATMGPGDRCNLYLADLQASFPAVSNIGIADAQGRVLCLNEGLVPGLRNDDRLYFRLARDTGKFAVGEYIVGRATGRRVLTYAYPVTDTQTGRFAGVVYASIKLEWFAEMLSRKPLADGASVTITDRNGTVLLQQPQAERAGERVPEAWLKLLESREAGVVDGGSVFDERDRLNAYVPATLPPKGLMIVVGIDKQRALAAIDRATQRVLVTSLVALLAGIALTLLLARVAVRRPVDRILEALRQWKAGDLHARTGLRGRAELSQIGEGFDEMIERLALRDRQRALAEAELRRSRDLAVEASASKTRFLASASHDLRQPLQALTLTVAALESRAHRAEDAPLHMRLGRAVRSLAELVDTLFDMSRIDAGLSTPELADVELGELLRQLEEEFAPIAAQHNVRMIVNPTGERVHSDPNLLGRLVRNLVSNALKFTPGGGVVRIDAQPSGEQIALSVIDSGVGIPHDKHAEIFEEFRQLDNPERDRRKGLGLGLSIVKRISALLDHPVTVSSEPGKGSVFTVWLPRASGSPRADAPRERRAEPGIVTLERRLRGQVLLVEDDELVAGATEEVLATWGLSVTLAHDGRTANAAIDAAPAPYDVVVADYRLPDITGLSVIEHARKRMSGVSAILVSGDLSDDLAQRVGDMDVLAASKPIRHAELHALLVEALEHEPRPRSAVHDARPE